MQFRLFDFHPKLFYVELIFLYDSKIVIKLEPAFYVALILKLHCMPKHFQSLHVRSTLHQVENAHNQNSNT